MEGDAGEVRKRNPTRKERCPLRNLQLRQLSRPRMETGVVVTGLVRHRGRSDGGYEGAE